MSRQANILLLLALAAGVVYGWFGVPFLLPLFSSDTPLAEDLDGPRLTEVDDIRLRMSLLRRGMREGEVDKILRLRGNKPCFFSGMLSSDVGWWTEWYPIDDKHTLYLKYDASRLVTAELRQGEQVTASMAAAKTPLGGK